MRKSIYFIYALFAAGLFLLILYQGIAFRNRVVEERPNESYSQLTTYDSFEETEARAPLRKKIVYRFHLESLPEGNNSLVFFTTHQNVRVLVDGESIYSLQPNTKNSFGNSSGYVWHAVSIYREDIGKEICVEVIPVYESSVNIVPDFYVGSRFNIWKDMLLGSSLSMVLSMLMIVIGIAFIVVGIYNYNNPDSDKSLLMLGAFSAALGIWQSADCAGLSLLFPKTIAFSSVPFIALMLISIPFVLFMKEQLSETGNPVWNIPCFASLAEIILVVFTQMLGIADFMETLWMTYLVMLLSIGTVAFMVIREVIRTGWTFRLKLDVICMGGCFVGVLVDIVFFYAYRGTVVILLGMALFLAYLIVIGFLSVKEARELISIGSRARRYEEMAYHDQLTGLLNRTAYSAFTTQPDFEPENYIVVMFDLNNLKQCNDTLGHQAGDCYIRDSARMIDEIFGDLGKCYRMGGDEFSALLKGCPLAKCKKKVEQLMEALDKYNQESPEIKMGIACGYELYDKRIDYDLGDTLRRADKVMYHQKIMMKQKT